MRHIICVLIPCLLAVLPVRAADSVMIYQDGETSLAPDSGYGPISLVMSSGIPTLRFADHSYGGIRFLNNGYGGTAIGFQMPAITDNGALEFWDGTTGPAVYLLRYHAPGIAYEKAGSSPSGFVTRWRGRLASEPSAPTAGEIYRNTGTGKVRLWDGTEWVDLN